MHSEVSHEDFAERFRTHTPPPEHGWSLDRKVGLSAILGVVGQFVLVIAIIVQARADISINRRDIDRNNVAITKIGEETSRIVRIDERLAGVVKGLSDLNDRLDRLLDKAGRR